MVAVQYRPFWFRLLDPRLTGGLIAVGILLALQAFANLFALASSVSQGNTGMLPFHAAAVAIYGAAAYGLMKINRWARFLAIVICLLSVVQGGIMMLYIDLLQGMITVVIYGLAGIYLLAAKCRAVFYPPAPPADED